MDRTRRAAHFNGLRRCRGRAGEGDHPRLRVTVRLATGARVGEDRTSVRGGDGREGPGLLFAAGGTTGAGVRQRWQVSAVLGGGLFKTPHGLRTDAEGNVWATD